MDKHKIAVLLVGVFLGVVLTATFSIGAYSLYQNSKNSPGLAQQLPLNNGNQLKVAGNTVLNKEVGGKEKRINKPISIFIDTTRAIKKVSSLLYGSNLRPKMENKGYIKKFVKDRGLTIFRFPGGGSPGYHWKIGKCDFYERANNGAPLSDIDNVIDFCRETNSTLVIQVNIESGTPQEAAEWVRYMNFEKGFPVIYWELGNEVYGDWDKAYMSGSEYATVVKKYATAMKAVDPAIKIGADFGSSKYDNFTRPLIKGAADYIDFVSYHWYPNHVNDSHIWEGKKRPKPLDVIGNTPHIALAVERLNRLLEELAPHRKGKIEMTFLEWDGTWDEPSSDPLPYEQGVVGWSLANAIFYADCLGQFATHGVTVSAQFELQGIGFGLIRGWDERAGWGGQPWDQKTVRPRAYSIEIFSKHFGDVLLDVRCDNVNTYFKKKDWWNGSYSGHIPYVSCYASKFSESGNLGIVLINKHPKDDFTVELNLGDFEPKKEGTLWILNGADILSQNDGFPETVGIKRYKMAGIKKRFHYTLPAHSVNAIEIEKEQEDDKML